VTLPGGWQIKLPGSFSEFEVDQEGDSFALDPPREIWFTAYRFSNAFSSQTFKTKKKALKKDHADLVIEHEDYYSQAWIDSKHGEDIGDYFVLNSSNVTPSMRVVCTILFSNPSDKAWAIDTWKTITSPTETAH
jgi:hypothetical protein